MAGRYAGAAVEDQFGWGSVAHQFSETGGQFSGIAEEAVAQIANVGQVGGSGNMAADGIVRFILAAEAVCAAGVDDERAAAGGFCQHLGGIDDQFGAGIGGKAAGWRGFGTAAGGQAGGGPGAPAAVQNGDGLVADPAQHPPHACGHTAAAVVIQRDLGLVADAQACDGTGKERCIRQGMAAGAAWHDRPGHVFVQMGVDCAGDVAASVGAAAGAGVAQVEAAINDAQVGCDRVICCSDSFCQLCATDKRAELLLRFVRHFFNSL